MSIQNFSSRKLTVNNHIIALFENPQIAFGYTHKGVTLKELSATIQNLACIQLTQIHSDIIFSSHHVREDSEGDGIIMTEKDKIGIIKTADCVPLFFWNRQFSTGGILHIGWRGLFRGIETKLIRLLKKMDIPATEMYFYLGPAIQKECYTVSEDLFHKFSNKPYGTKIFRENPSGNYQMDIKQGIIMSLVSMGITEFNIGDSGICTFCQNQSFPSFRFSGGSNERIYNYFVLKSNYQKKQSQRARF